MSALIVAYNDGVCHPIDITEQSNRDGERREFLVFRRLCPAFRLLIEVFVS